MTAVKLEDARRVISAGRRKPGKWPAHEHPVADEAETRSDARMDNAWIGSIDISMKKAYTSRAFEIETKELGQSILNREASSSAFMFQTTENHDFLLAASRETGWQGSRAIGISGGSGDQDHAVAAAGAAAF